MPKHLIKMETKVVSTPSGVKVELKTFLTGRELRAMEKALFDGLQLTEEGGKRDLKPSGDAILKCEEKTFEIIVVSVNGEKENILEKIFNLEGKDYLFIKREIDKITQDYEFELKKKS